MNWGIRTLVGTRTLSCLALLACLLVAAWSWQHHRGRQPRTVDMTGWDIARLVQHLRARGLRLHAVSTMATARDPQRAYLTTADLNWEQISRLARSSSFIDQWRGTVFCELNHDPAYRADARLGMDSYSLDREPFVFVGDPDLLDAIETALTDGG